MGILSFLKKEGNCDFCGKVTLKKELFGFDSTLYGTRENGEDLRLCRSCFFTKLKESILNYKGNAIFYYPNNTNSYDYFKFNVSDEEAEELGYDENFPKKHIDLMPNGLERCKTCGEIAQYAWCCGKISTIDIFNLTEIEKEDLITEHLCAECLIETLESAINNENIILDRFNPPVDGDGICVSSEC